MRKLAIVMLLVAMTSPAFASKRVSVSQLEEVLAATPGKTDAEVAQQISDMELTERLSSDRLSRLKAVLPGDKARQNLLILADRSAFLDPPASEIPGIPTPDFAEQRRIMGLAVTYIGRTIPLLPNFFATRETTYFEDTPLLQRATDSVAYQPLHFVRASSETVLYRDGRETVDPGPVKKTAATDHGLKTWGVFGPILGTVLVDAARSKLAWSHWERGSGGPEAVFRYEVPKEKSHYEVNYCCTPKSEAEWNELATFRQLSGYHGEIAISPQDGTIVRLSVEANLASVDPITEAALVVEYGSVEIGGKRYFCPVKSVSISIAQEVRYSNDGQHRALQFVMRPLKTMLNDVVFEQYHMFRADVRVLPESEANDKSNPNIPEGANSAAVAIAPQPAPTETVPEKAESAILPVLPAPAESTTAAPPTTPSTPTAVTEDSAVQAPILRTTTREVVVDVVVTKNNGEPVVGLPRQDFAVMEDGKPQSIDFFEERTNSGGVPNAPPEMPPMPAGTRTNVPPVPEGDAVNVLLLDTLNTEPQDQAYMHREVMDCLTRMQPGTRVAIFILGSQLRFVQGFTTDTSALVAALNDKRNGMKVGKNQSARSRSDEADDAADIAQLQVMQVSPAAIAAIRQAQADSRAHNAGDRASMTFEALNYLGHYLAGVPGRKNLIWFASSFPVIIWIIGNGDRGVSLFFIVSGFVLALPFARHFFAGAQPVSLRKYFIRRLTRLEPPYVLSILLFVILLFVYTRQFSGGVLSHAAVTMLYLHRLVYGQRTFINPVSWSLEIEVQFYILAPLFMQLYAVRGKLLRRVLIASLIIAISVAQFAIVGSPRASESILFYAQFFLMGLLIADIYIVDGDRVPSSLLWDAAGILGLAFTFCMTRTFVTSQVALPWAMALLFASALRGMVLRRFFANPWIAAIGGMCYSIYLMHFQMIAVFFKLTRMCIVPQFNFLGNFAIQLLVTGVPVMLISLVFYLLIERPCMDPNWPSRFWHWITGRRGSEARAFDSGGISG